MMTLSYTWGLGDTNPITVPGDMDLSLSSQRSFSSGPPHHLLGREEAQQTMGEQSFGPVPPEFLPSALPSRILGLSLPELTTNTPAQQLFSVHSEESALTQFPSPVPPHSLLNSSPFPLPSPHLWPIGLRLHGFYLIHTPSQLLCTVHVQQQWTSFTPSPKYQGYPSYSPHPSLRYTPTCRH